MSRKKVIIWTILGVLIIVLIIISSTISGSLNKTVIAKKLEITKEINAGIPYEWKYEIKDTDIVECSEIYVLNDENINGKVGAPVNRNYVFRGLKKGTTTITFKFVSITDEKDSTIETYKVKVDRDLNVSLIK